MSVLFLFRSCLPRKVARDKFSRCVLGQLDVVPGLRQALPGEMCCSMVCYRTSWWRASRPWEGRIAVPDMAFAQDRGELDGKVRAGMDG